MNQFYQHKYLIHNTLLGDQPDEVMENIEEYFTYKPINSNFTRVPEHSEEHMFYSVHLRNTVLEETEKIYKLLGLTVPTFQKIVEGMEGAYYDSKGNSWRMGDPIPNPGLTYKGKLTIHLYADFKILAKHDLSLASINRKLEFKIRNQEDSRIWDYGYAIGGGLEINLSCLGIANISSIENFMQENQFERVVVGSNTKSKQTTLLNACRAFLIYNDCCSHLDIRGLQFDLNTQAEKMFALVECKLKGEMGSGLRELVVTPEQYQLFTSKEYFENKTKERKEALKKAKSQVFKNHDLLDMVGLGKKLLRLEEECNREIEQWQGSEFGADFFYGINDDEWEKFKEIIVVKELEDTTEEQVYEVQKLEDDAGYYTYTPVDSQMREVPEGSIEHMYYKVALRDILEDLHFRGLFPKDKPLPASGLQYRGKPVVSFSTYFWHEQYTKDLDMTAFHVNKVLQYQFKINEEDKSTVEEYIVSNGEEIDLSVLGLQDVTDLRGFIQTNQYKKIIIKQPMERYESQKVLKSARAAFYGLDVRCKSLDMRGLKFDCDTDATRMLDQVVLATDERTLGLGIEELIITPEQYELFTSKECKMKDRALEQWEQNRNICLQCNTEGELTRQKKYWQKEFDGLQAREYGSFFFVGRYDFNEEDMKRWEALKSCIVIKELWED